MKEEEKKFITTVWEYYKHHGRHDLPWRKTTAPYKILVSEVMLQQTQVDRVVPKYKEFLKRFPTVRALANAPLGDVVRAWQGLGYNRRARMLHEAAKAVVEEHRGRFSKDAPSLTALPGIGPYTAAAVMAFAYNEPVALIETNVRTVYLHHFFGDQTDVADADIMPVIERTLERECPREWYWALMDYGAYLKRTQGSQNSRSKHYKKQSTFEGSDRQIRGAILRLLSSEHRLSRRKMHAKLAPFEDVRIDAQVERLLTEEMLIARRGSYALPE